MMGPEKKYIGFSCAYTPVQLIDAAGFIPWKILPAGSWPERAGEILHENLCPNVKRILDRARGDDLPGLAGVVFMNSCDAMRRLSDAWIKVRPDHRIVVLDLPVSNNKSSLSYFKTELERMIEKLEEWSGEEINDDKIPPSIERYNRLTESVTLIRKQHKEGKLNGGSSRLQEIYNSAVIEDPELTLKKLEETLQENQPGREKSNVPVFLFGNVFPDPEAYSIFKSAGAEVVWDDLCTGSRMFQTVNLQKTDDNLEALAGGILNRAPCARTIFSRDPDRIFNELIEKYRESGAKGIIFHTVKFCDPYLSRLPYLRKKIREQGIPFLSLEGDCTTRSMGQQLTRIEAFVEMLR